MAGVIPTRRSTSGRKQWTIHDGPRCSLKRLRNQLASEGCPESQVVLAKQLLEEKCDLEVDKLENARLGVYWLIKASEQGNVEATEMLKTCFETGRGITEQNYLDVKSCITMTQDEKLARKAAREMFASLSNGEDYITSDQLQRKMLEIDKDEKPVKKIENDVNACGEPCSSQNGELVNNYDEHSSESDEEVDWNQRAEGSNEKLTEDHLISAAVDYSHGHLPIVNRILCLQEPNLQALDHIPLIHRPILHPFLALKILYYKLIKFLGRQPYFSHISFAKTDLQWFSLLILYVFVSAETTLYFLPLAIYYFSFLVMTISTFQMLQDKRDFSDFRLWSGLFICYSGGSLNAEQAEYQYIKNNLKPYGHFFLALLFNLMVYPIILEQSLPQSELSIVAFCFTFMTLLGFMPKKRLKTIPDLLVLFSFAINVLAKYPYETDPVVTQGWRFLDLKIPTFASYIIGNGIEFCINFRLLLYVCIPILFGKVACRENWKGTYKFLIPHCVSLSWLQLVIINSQGATMFGLLRGTLALVGVVLFLPLVGLTTIFLPAVALTKWLMSSNIFYTFSIFLIFLILGYALCWVLANSRFKTYTALLQMCLGLFALYFLTSALIKDPLINNEFYLIKQAPMGLSWQQYQKFCFEPASNRNIAQMQLQCSKFENVPIQWDGYVSSITLTSIKNSKKALIDKLPTLLRDYLYCYYGEKIENNCDNSENLSYEDCIKFYEIVKSNQRCTLDNYNKYNFNIIVRMQSGIWDKGSEVIIDVENYFKNFTLLLKPEDNIWFKGSLMQNIVINSQKVRAKVKLQEIGCLTCANSKLTEIKNELPEEMTLKKIINDIYLGVKSVLNFLFHPIVVFK